MRSVVGALCAVLIAGSAAHGAEPPKIAAAASLSGVLPELAALYEAEEDMKPDFVFGASGQLVTSIRQGAPFDAFISADMGLPSRLRSEGLVDGYPRSVARGQLLLWVASIHTNVVDLQGLTNAAVKRIAIANPSTAPYGTAAKQVLKLSLLFDAVEPRLVTAESVAQVNQFIAAGSVDAAFTAASAKSVEKLATNGTWLVVDTSLYQPLDHGAILLKRRGKSYPSPVADDFLHFITSEKCRDVWRRFGYVPVNEQAEGDR